MQTATMTRREAAEALGVTYSTLRVYERHLAGVISLSQGPNRTTLYDEQALDLMRRAIDRKRSGLPFSKLEPFFRGELAPAEAVPEARSKLNEIHTRTEEILSIGQRIEEKLRAVERLFSGGVVAEETAGKGTDHA
jgi:DNA-binding transcriptional MerR regulator